VDEQIAIAGRGEIACGLAASAVYRRVRARAQERPRFHAY
jgi:hypothetical protein